MVLDFINDIVDSIKGLFHREEKPVPVSQSKPVAPNIPYDYKINKPPDLFDIPQDLTTYAAKWLIRGGMSPEGAAAMIGNLWRESYLNPAQIQIDSSGVPRGPGRGVAQWTDTTLTKRSSDDGKGRWDLYRKEFFPNLKTSHDYWKAHTIEGLEPQLAFIIYELKEEFPGVWRNLTTPGSLRDKTIMVLKKYEVARDRDVPEEQNLRVNIAEKIYGFIKQDQAKEAAVAKKTKK